MEDKDKKQLSSTPKKHNAFVDWVNGEERPKEEKTVIRENIRRPKKEKKIDEIKNYKKFKKVYIGLAIAMCCAFIVLLLVAVNFDPSFGVIDAPTNNEVATKYIEDGVTDTGATNVIASMILDYRAFDTLGESTVLFSAVAAVIILLRRDEEKRSAKEKAEFDAETATLKEETLTEEKYPNIILQVISKYVGAGLILYAVSFGERKAKKFFNFKIFTAITSGALLTYAGLKCYSFYTGANHLHSIISTGTPGAILSGGLILPLNICVGLIVACTMFGFYKLFSKGEI